MQRNRRTDEELDDSSLPIPASRMRNMMKSSPDVDCVSTESVICLIKATELFIKDLVFLACQKKTEGLTYKDLSDIQAKYPRYSFLSDILPPKITVQEWNDKYKNLYYA